MMELAFFVSGLVALISAIKVVTNANPVHALLYMIVLLLAIAMIFFAIGAPFAGVLEIIVYAGAIVVLFMFAIMLLNLGDEIVKQELQWTKPGLWTGPMILAGILLAQTLYAVGSGGWDAVMGLQSINSKQVGIALFGPYLICVELASILLLAALVATYHLGRVDEKE